MTSTNAESRRVVSAIFMGAGFLLALTAGLVNPWLVRAIRGPLIYEYLDAIYAYRWWSITLGVGAIVLGFRVRLGRSVADKICIPYVLCAGFLLADRLLLVGIGQSMYMYDPLTHYVHRPGARRSLWADNRPDDIIQINSHGFHDNEFPRRKPDGELRGLMIGDSVTMGFAVTYAETFCKKLEELCNARDSRHNSHEIINAGVHGYSTLQERITLERNLDLRPDFVGVGFCMNDVTEPFAVNRALGGTGLDYHKVVQTPNPLMGYLANETGVGRALRRLAQRSNSVEVAKRAEFYDTRQMARDSRLVPKYQEAWGFILPELAKAYHACRANNIPVVLMIFPFTFQLNDPTALVPQEMLIQHAAEHGVDVIDFTPILSNAIYLEEDVVRLLESKGRSPSEIEQYYRWKVNEYFIDDDHFTERGHSLVAQHLFEWMIKRGLVNGD